jgi:hypothetical protein
MLLPLIFSIVQSKKFKRLVAASHGYALHCPEPEVHSMGNILAAMVTNWLLSCWCPASSVKEVE